jgi:hypothetical protein
MAVAVEQDVFGLEVSVDAPDVTVLQRQQQWYRSPET